jgi:acyl dehydratase
LSSVEHTTTTVSVSELPKLAGKDLGVSRWVEIPQRDIDAFAELTGDRQWIHIDPERAKTSPFGSTVAHGFYTLALSTEFVYELLDVHDATQILNYGLNKVRFPAPTPAGSRVRMAMRVADVAPVPGGYQATYALTFERDGATKPVCVAELVFRYTGPDNTRTDAS